MTTTPSIHSRRKQSGLSLVELMVSITLGLLILAGTITIFANSSQTRAEVEKTSRQIENGRYAIQLLTEDLHMAGFLGDHVPSTTAPTIELPDPCATDLATIDAAKCTAHPRLRQQHQPELHF